MKRAIGVAALGGGLLALGAGAASAQEVSADVRLGRQTSAEVRVCADGRVLSGLLGSCSSQTGSGGTSVSVQAGRDAADTPAVRARARVPRVASADVSLGTRRGRPGSGQASVSAEASVAPRAADADADATVAGGPRAQADVAVRALRPRPLLDLDLLLASPAGAGLLGTSPFTLAGDAADPARRARGEAEWAFMRRRWGRLLDEDPYHNPNVLLHAEPVAVPSPPRRQRPWRRALAPDANAGRDPWAVPRPEHG
jgi:hypothetical protein